MQRICPLGNLHFAAPDKSGSICTLHAEQCSPIIVICTSVALVRNPYPGTVLQREEIALVRVENSGCRIEAVECGVPWHLISRRTRVVNAFLEWSPEGLVRIEFLICGEVGLVEPVGLVTVWPCIYEGHRMRKGPLYGADFLGAGHIFPFRNCVFAVEDGLGICLGKGIRDFLHSSDRKSVV